MEAAQNKVGLWLVGALPVLYKVGMALALWVVGRMLIRFVGRATTRLCQQRKIDVTLTRYAASSVNIGLTVLLVIAVAGTFGVETTSFAAFIAAAGVAIGAAWSGILGNFAAGVFLMVFRPIRVGDTITVGSVTGEVKEVGLVTTAVDTVENVRVFIGNTKLFGDNIANLTMNPRRNLVVPIHLLPGTDVAAFVETLKAAVQGLPHVTDAPVVAPAGYAPLGPVVKVVAWCPSAHVPEVTDAIHIAVMHVLPRVGGGTVTEVSAIRSMAGAATATGTGTV
jgi:small conductance mechanosensitive channel